MVSQVSGSKQCWITHRYQDLYLRRTDRYWEDWKMWPANCTQTTQAMTWSLDLKTMISLITLFWKRPTWSPRRMSLRRSLLLRSSGKMARISLRRKSKRRTRRGSKQRQYSRRVSLISSKLWKCQNWRMTNTTTRKKRSWERSGTRWTMIKILEMSLRTS